MQTTREQHDAIMQRILAMPNVEDVKYDESADEWHANGKMSNSIVQGWWFVGHPADILKQIELENQTSD